MKKNFIAVLGAIVTLAGCSLPMNQSVIQKAPLPVVDEQHWVRTHVDDKLQQGLTGYVPLDDAFLSISSRIYLIRNAQSHVELQYYIWNNDFIGNLMLSELLKAADRGVQVKLLIDDQNGTQLDETLKVLAAHPNIQIKLFNPYKYRNFRTFDYLLRAGKINHRMHNKLIIADGSIAVTGGRNISSEYFDAGEEFQFRDMDILFYGTAVKQANTIYQEFWNDHLSYSIEQLVGKGSTAELEQLRVSYINLEKDNNITQKRLTDAEMSLREKLKEHPMQWSKADFLADSPKKITADATKEELLYHKILQHMDKPKQQMDLVSAYFIPTDVGEEFLSNLAKNNVDVRVLTNSLPANDVAMVHSFYQKYRVELLKNGVQLYEFKPHLQQGKSSWYERATGRIISTKGKSNSRLHAKFFTMDDKVFIGSFNFDPRSALLNTEVGLVVESADFQQRISHALDINLPLIAYKLELNEKGELVWLEQMPDGTVVKHDKEPNTTKFQRGVVKFISWFPVEGMM